MSYIEENGYFTFDGVQSSNYGVWINGGGSYNAPARRGKEYVIPGRNGVLTIDDGTFEELEVTYPAFIARDFPSNIEGIRNELLSRVGYVRLEDSYHPDEYYRARFAGGLNVNVAPGGAAGSFDIKFRRDARRFLKSGEDAIGFSGATTIANPTKFASKPIIRFSSGGGDVVINGKTLSAGGFSSSITAYIDCDLQACYTSNGDDITGYVTLPDNKFPVLLPGNNSVSSTVFVNIIPNWWII